MSKFLEVLPPNHPAVKKLEKMVEVLKHERDMLNAQIEATERMIKLLQTYPEDLPHGNQPN